MNEELNSQLSAMFDDELPPAECELLARRLSKDEQLKARWSRYAMIGAAIRQERGVLLNSRLAARVSAVVTSEPALTEPVAPKRRSRAATKWLQPLASLAVAAGVAAVAILWMRSQAEPDTVTIISPQQSVVAASNIANPSTDKPVLAAANTDAGEVHSYVVPKTPARRIVVVPTTELANYVVAHSEFSSPVTRRNLLSALMSGESGNTATSPRSEEPSEDVHDDDKTTQ